MSSSNNQTILPNEVIEIDSLVKYRAVLDRFRDDLIILNFYTRSCSVCAAFKPYFYAVQKEMSGDKVVFARVNSEFVSSVAQEFGIMAVPTTVFLKNKMEIHRVMGMYPTPQFRDVVRDVLAKFFNIKKKSTDESMFI